MKKLCFQELSFTSWEVEYKTFGLLQAVNSKEKPAPPKDVKPAVTSEASEVKPAPVVKPVSLTYEAYYAKLTQESELHKFKVGSFCSC